MRCPPPAALEATSATHSSTGLPYARRAGRCPPRVRCGCCRAHAALGRAWARFHLYTVCSSLCRPMCRRGPRRGRGWRLTLAIGVSTRIRSSAGSSPSGRSFPSSTWAQLSVGWSTSNRRPRHSARRPCCGQPRSHRKPVCLGRLRLPAAGKRDCGSGWRHPGLLCEAHVGHVALLRRCGVSTALPAVEAAVCEYHAFPLLPRVGCVL